MRKISFNLEKWLQDKSRKIRTGDGRPVRIICIDRKGKSGNIVGLVGEDESLIYVWNNNGIHIVSCMEENNLFFAEEDKTIDDTEMNSLAYLTELGYTCIPHKEEQNARSEEDERIYQSILDDTVQENQLDGKQFVWLKSIKDRVQPKIKQEWSEEEGKNLSQIILLLDQLNHIEGFKGIKISNDIPSLINWLKSIKPNHWKPSEQNIKDLEWCSDLVKDKMGVGFHRLQVFIDEIKKL